MTSCNKFKNMFCRCFVSKNSSHNSEEKQKIEESERAIFSRSKKYRQAYPSDSNTLLAYTSNSQKNKSSTRVLDEFYLPIDKTQSELLVIVQKNVPISKQVIIIESPRNVN